MKQSIINETTKWDQFKLINSNRPVQHKHVQQLKKAIEKKNLLHLNPIIVDAKKNVIDGQHRLQAAKELKLPVYYMVDDTINEGDIADLNTNKSNWSVDNYIEYWFKKGNENFKLIKKFKNEFPQVNYSIACEMLTKHFQFGEITKSVKQGTYVCDNYAGAADVINKVNDFSEFKYRFDRAFIRALKQCMDTGEYDHAVMLGKLEKQPGVLIRQANVEQYVLLLEKIYNRSSSINVVNFRLTRALREKIELKRKKEVEREAKAQLKRKKTKKGWSEKKFAENFLKGDGVKKDAAEKTVKVVIDKKTTVWVKPGTDIVALRKKYADKKLQEVGE